MTHPPYSPAEPDDPEHFETIESPAAGRRGSRRTMVAVAATVGGTLLLGGTGYAVASYLGGGGPQPEDVLPADTVAFAKIDLDPAMSQKTAVFSLLEKFPDIETGAGDDLAGTLFDGLLEEMPYDLDYDRDIRPWLGDRMAVAAVPAPDSEAGVAPVLVLAVTDEQAMEDALGGVADADFGFAVREEFVLVTDTQENADRLAAGETSLADEDGYSDDLDSLDGDQIAVVWADLAAVQELIGSSGMVPTETVFGTQELTGSAIVGVHAESDALEVVGVTNGWTSWEGAQPGVEPTRLIESLPADTLAALSFSGAGPAIADAYEQQSDSEAFAGLAEQAAAMGLTLPDDLVAVFGTDAAVAVLGDWENPAFGVRVDSDDPDRATEIIADLTGDPEMSLPVVLDTVDDGYVAAIDPGTLATLGSGGGGLTGSDAFQAAVADADDAGFIGYVRVAGLIDQVTAMGGADASQAENFAAIEAVGFSATTTDEGDSRFVLRVTTR